MTKTPDPSLGVDRVVIRPCDYCGRQQTEDDIRLDDDETKWCYWLECECGARGPVTGWYRDAAVGKLWAVRLWNRDGDAIAAMRGHWKAG